MEIDEIVNKLKYYTPVLPIDALEDAINHKEEITPRLLDMLKYTEENLDKICSDEDDFFGYTYAFMLLAEFREPKMFPYLINLLKNDEWIVEYILGDDYTDLLPRLIASVYDGNDEAIFEIIENSDIDEFVRASVLNSFAILYFNGVKDREFLINYFIKLLNEKKEDDDSYIYLEIVYISCDLKLVELEDILNNFWYLINNEEEIDYLKSEFLDRKELDRNDFPFIPLYEYIHDSIEIMDGWQCFRELEDEEFEKSNEYNELNNIIQNRMDDFELVKNSMERNEECFCDSGKKYKKCCYNKDYSDFYDLVDFVDKNVCRAEWYFENEQYKRAREYFNAAWLLFKDICIKNKIRVFDECNKIYDGYDFFTDWIQTYDDVLNIIDDNISREMRLKLWEDIEYIFDLNDVDNGYWKEKCIRAKAHIEFQLKKR